MKFIQTRQLKNSMMSNLAWTNKVTRLPSNLRQTTRKCMYWVRRGHFHFQSPGKHGGHTIWSAISENPMMHVIFCNRRYCPSKSYIERIGSFALFCSCDLEVDPMTFIYELDPYPLWISSQTGNELSTSTLSKVIVLPTDIQTDRHTDRHHRKHYHAASRW